MLRERHRPAHGARLCINLRGVQTCGAEKVYKILFPLRRRACVKCMKKKCADTALSLCCRCALIFACSMIWEKKFYDEALLELLPYSNGKHETACVLRSGFSFASSWPLGHTDMRPAASSIGNRT